jgi:uncharacterized protein (TIGR03382 family)
MRLSGLGRDLHLFRCAMKKTNTFLTGSLTVAVLGCGGVSGIPIEKTATDFAKAICPKAYDCCTMEQLMKNAAAGMTEAECETKTATNFRSYLQNMQSSENAGRSKYDEMKVDACLQAIRAATCSQLTMITNLSGLPECDSTFATPLVASGGTCVNDFECIDSVCQIPEAGGAGTCVAGVPAGGSCGSTAHCAQNLLCDPRDGSIATDDVCVVEQEIGGTCADNFECKSRNCSSSGSGGAMTCQAPSAPVCFYGGGCSAGGKPGAATLLLMGVFAAFALYRARRAARSRQ